VEWMQNPSTYAPQIQQLDLDSVFDFPEKTAMSSVLSPRQLYDIIELIAHPNQMISLSCPSHTIGLYQRGKKYYLFDPNYDEGVAHVFTNKKLLAQEMVKCLFKNLSIPTMKIALEINVVTNPDKKTKNKSTINKTEFLQHVASTSEQVNGVDDFGMNSLYLACENNDVVTAEYLLQRGALPNQQRKDGETPLFAAALRGYTKLVNLLLAHGAKSSVTDIDGLSPLYTAIENDHLDVVQALLENGANPIQQTKCRFTPLALAITNQKWDVFLLMLPFIKNLGTTLEIHREELNAHKDEIMAAHHQAAKTNSPQTQKQIFNLLKQTFVEPKSIQQLLVERSLATRNRYRFFPITKQADVEMAIDNTSEPVLQQFTPTG
jgi:hypothetical protein